MEGGSVEPIDDCSKAPIQEHSRSHLVADRWLTVVTPRTFILSAAGHPPLNGSPSASGSNRRPPFGAGRLRRPAPPPG